MKRCPTCDKTFEDSMRFCQTDGTPLVDDEPAFDPFATIVAPAQPKKPETDVAANTSEKAIGEPDEILDIPPADPLKTMYVSDAEMRAALGTEGAPLPAEPEIVEIPPIEEGGSTQEKQESIPEPEPPQFTVPEVPAPSFGDMAPPPSPFATGGKAEDRPMAAPSRNIEPETTAPFAEAETIIQPTFPTAYDPQPPAASAPAAEWIPPTAGDQGWQNQQIAGNPSFQPAMVDGQNKTLAIISLICGIASLICCSWFLPGIAAVVLGFIARGKAKSNPAEYGGAGMALAGIITGGISLVMGVIVIILYLAGAMAGSIGNF
jgi:hypothetical protein